METSEIRAGRIIFLVQRYLALSRLETNRTGQPIGWAVFGFKIRGLRAVHKAIAAIEAQHHDKSPQIYLQASVLVQVVVEFIEI